MLQALIHKELKSSFSAPMFKPSEDSLTSFIIGLLQYLPSNLVAQILKKTCGVTSCFPATLGEIKTVKFGEHLDAAKTTNHNFVEPDVWIETTTYHIIIEVKKNDGNGQYEQEWCNEIQALLNSIKCDGQKIMVFKYIIT